MRGERHEEQHELDEDYYDLPDQTNNSSRGGGADDTKNDDQEDLGEEVDRREVLPRHVRHSTTEIGRGELREVPVRHRRH